MAMRMGKHCFCQKPLTHSIYEARLMAKVAREMKVATQMGNQGTADQPVAARRRPSIKAGVLGTVKEVHVWTEPADLAARRPAAGKPATARALELGPVAWPGARAALRRRLSSVRLARLVGFRHRRLGRHGLPHREHALHGLEPSRSGRRSGQMLGPQQGQLSEVVENRLRLPRHCATGRR